MRVLHHTMVRLGLLAVVVCLPFLVAPEAWGQSVLGETWTAAYPSRFFLLPYVMFIAIGVACRIMIRAIGAERRAMRLQFYLAPAGHLHATCRRHDVRADRSRLCGRHYHGVHGGGVVPRRVCEECSDTPARRAAHHRRTRSLTSTARAHTPFQRGIGDQALQLYNDEFQIGLTNEPADG